ncbi:MAG: TlpA family protein disulfide reductase [Candidatus Zixiibacteriota bacterium]
MIKITHKKVLIAGTLTALLAILSCSGKSESTQAGSPGVAQIAEVSGAAPLFSAQDLSGRWQSADQWLGKQPVVINFWGTWCPPCRREIPDLVKLYDEYSPKGVTLISLAVNDSPEKVREYAAANDMEWILLMAEDQILIDYEATTGIPTTIFFDKNGHEITRFIGMRDYETLKKGFDAIL